jgi:hypothetical protein
MTRLRMYQCAVLALIVAFCAFGQLAVAQSAPRTAPHYVVKAVPHTPSSGAHPNFTITKDLYPTWAAFAGTPVGEISNTDGTDGWPCFGGGSSPNPDCPTIGDPTVNFPTNGLAIGAPSYTWSLSNCNATSTTTPPCGQTETWYEDDTNDSADFLTYSIEATQGTSIIADSGVVVFGPNTFGGLSPAANVIIYGDQNFGTMGLTGPNNGNCDADFGYPLTSPTFTSTYVVQAGKTCVAPVAGPVTITAITEVGTPKYTKSTKTSVCGSVGVPCYTVKFTKKYSLTQKWTIVVD